ncbi:MAG: ABC transporter ATP-binding protein [Actinobacteria bacterium]|nr:ABC transporter ATP-binding protein [Actinomycetota bacterium]
MQLKEVKHSYPRPGGETLTVLTGVDLTLEQGDVVSIVGPSGGGKTTLLNIIGCLLKPTSGQVVIDGKPIQSMTERELARLRNQKIGFIFQGSHLIPTLTVLENIMLPVWLGAGISARSQQLRARELARRFGLEDRLNHLPHELSLGQRRRVAIARALINRPAILLADEPTNDLDPPRAQQIADILFSLNQEGLTLLLVTHRWELAQQAQRCYETKDGQLQSVEVWQKENIAEAD